MNRLDLAGDRRGAEQRRCCARIRSVAACRNQMVPRGGRQRCSESRRSPLSGRYLSLVEREEIALLRVQGHSMQKIGRRLGRAASTISRELRRNAATRSGGLEYRATTAQWHADRSTRRPKATKLALDATLRTYVEERLAGVVVAPSGTPVHGPTVPWKGRRHGPRRIGDGPRPGARSRSPDACGSTSRTTKPCASPRSHLSALFVQGRRVLRRELTACLRTGRVLRVPRARVRRRGKGFVTLRPKLQGPGVKGGI